MMLAEEQFPSCKNLMRSDAYHDIKRSNCARTGNARLDDLGYLSFLKEDDSIEEQYKIILNSLLKNSLLHMDERVNAAPTKKIDSKPKKRLNTITKKRARKDVVDGCNGTEEENDHQYELFLQHLKGKGKAYAIEYMKDGLLTQFAYEEEVGSDKEGEPQPEPRRKPSRACNVVHDRNPRMLPRAPENNCGPSNQRKYVPQSIKKVRDSVKVEKVDGWNDYVMPNPKNPCIRQNIRLHADQNVSMLKSHLVVNEKQRNWFSNLMPAVENQGATFVKKTKGPARGKSRNETNIKEENHVHRNETDIKKENHVHRNDKLEDHGSAENEIRRKQHVKNLVREVKQEPKLPHLMSGKNVKSLASKKSKNEAQKVRIGKCSPSEHRKSVVANCFTAHKKVEEKNHKEVKYGSDSDVEILDDALYLKKGINHPFVFSKKFSESMMEDGNQQVGRPSACDEFRTAVVKALRKPFDKEEYKSHQKTIQDLCYFDYYPDLQQKLKKFRYNKKKRLAILRGFFFYLQNVTREGSFKPWKDRACLMVEPPSP